MKDLKEYILKFVELKYTPETNYDHNGWGFGHDWNSMFPKHIKIDADIKNGIQTSLSVMFRYNASYGEDGTDFRVENIKNWLKIDNLVPPPSNMEKSLHNGTYLIYYFLKIQNRINKILERKSKLTT